MRAERDTASISGAVAERGVAERAEAGGAAESGASAERDTASMQHIE